MLFRREYLLVSRKVAQREISISRSSFLPCRDTSNPNIFALALVQNVYTSENVQISPVYVDAYAVSLRVRRHN